MHCSCTTLTLARRHTCSERHPDVDDACAAARERPERRFLERRCSASTAIAQPLPIASLRRAECSAAIAVEESKRSAPAVARSLDRRAACELLSRCQLPVTREGAAAPAWRLHRRTDAFAFATNTARAAPAIWPRVAPADCPLAERQMLFSNVSCQRTRSVALGVRFATFFSGKTPHVKRMDRARRSVEDAGFI
jgi:hypothetical protein